MRNKVLCNVCTLVVAIGVLAEAAAQPYPSKPIQFIVNNSPGAGTDLAARLVADRLNKSLGTIIVENRAGGSGAIAMEFVKKAAPDGYTILAAADAAAPQTNLMVISKYKIGGG